MKRQTALRHLDELAEASSDLLRFRGTTEWGWPVEELWVSGDLLTEAPTIEDSHIVMVLDLPASKVPWMAMVREGEWAGEMLRLGKRPFSWWYRSAAWPAWSYQHRRVVRFWTATGGADESDLAALRAPASAELPVVEPSPADLAAQIKVELRVSQRHLAHVVERYWDQHRGRADDASAREDRLWRAAAAVSRMTAALEELDGAPS